MRKALLLFIAFVTTTASFAQSYYGYQSSNYNGVNGVFFNPANIADSRYRWDVNLFGINAGVFNNTASFNFKTLSDLTDKNADSIFLSGSKDNFSGLANIDILGPSLMFNASKKLSFALTSRFRTLVNVDDIDTKLIKSINSNTDDITLPYNINSGKNQKIIANSFVDLGASVGMVLYNNEQHFLKGGLTVKYLGGVGNAFVNIDNVQGTVNEDINDVFLTNATGRVAVGQGGIDPGNVDGNDIFNFKSNGFGGDIGFVYEYRPNRDEDNAFDNNYKFRAGLSVLDIGAVRYKKSPSQYSADYSMNIPANSKLYLSDFADKDFEEIKKYLDNSPFFTNNSTDNNSYTVTLPTSLRANIDYHIHRGFYADVATQISLAKKTTNTNSFYQNSVTLTPRFESNAVSVFVPLNYNTYSGFNAGFGLRAGPFYLGSGSIFNALLGDSKQADVYFGFHVSSLKRNRKKAKEVIIEEIHTTTTIRDTVVVRDTVQIAPKVTDTDGDGLNDNIDNCPTVAGLAKYNGCPIPDTDKDGINDEEDKCVTVPGLPKYNGCPIPDTDGDGVNDEEDKCPTVPGTRENSGCPEIKKEVIKKVNYAASHLLFATGKSTILPASYPAMNQLVAVLKSDNTLQLAIEGHTDNVGKPNKNQLLSEARANAAKAYLVKKGIDADRISTAGYGDTKPVADNKTAAGRAKNRRIEMKVNN